MNDIEELIEFWDQDILNHYFDGKYNELNKNLNYNLYLTEENSKLQASNKSLNEMIFLHYSGSYKPWTVRGVYNRKSIFYHLVYRKLFSEKFHITTTWRVGSLLQFFKGILNLDFLYLKNKISFIKITIKTIFKNMKINNKYISEDDLITSYNVARKCDKVFVEAVTHDQFENIKNEHSKIISKNDILIVYKNTRLEICENDVIFCHSNFIHELFFLLKNIDNLKNIKLVTSQSDVKITKQLFKTKPKCISEWYGINIDYEHEKLFPIPLGIANNYSPKNLTYSNFLAKESFT